MCLWNGDDGEKAFWEESQGSSKPLEDDWIFVSGELWQNWVKQCNICAELPWANAFVFEQTFWEICSFMFLLT